MLNRYSKLPQATIRNTQVLTDLGIIDSAFQRKQKQYDTSAANIGSTVQGAEGLQFFGDAANNYKSQIVNDVKAKASELSNMDLADPNVTKGFNQYAQQLASDPELQKHAQAKAMYDNYQKTKEDLATKGKLPTSADILRNQAWNNYSKTGQLSSEATEPLYEAQDLIKGRGDLVNMLKANGTDIIQSLSDGTAYKNSSKGIASDRIKKAVEAQLPTYMNSAYGRQEADDYKVAKMSGSIPQNESFADYLTRQVMSTASNYAYSDFSTNKDVALRDKQGRDLKKKEEDAYAGEGYTPAMNLTKKVEVDSDGNYDLPWYMDAYDYLSDSDSRTKEEKQIIDDMKVSYKKSGFKGDFKDYIAESNKDPNIRVSYYNSDKANKVSKQFFNPSTGGGTYINTPAWSEEQGKWIPFVELMDEKGLSKDDLKKGFTITGDIQPDNPLTPNGRQIVVGNTSVILENKDSKTSTENEFIHKASQAKYNGTGKTTFEFFNPADKKYYNVTAYSDGQQITKVDKEEIK